MTTITAYIEKDIETGLYMGFVPGIPGAHTQADTLDELRDNLGEVIELCLEEMEPETKQQLPQFVEIQHYKITNKQCPNGHKKASSKSNSVNTGKNSLNVAVGCKNVHDVYVDNSTTVVKSESEEPVIYYKDIATKLPINLETIGYIEKISLILGLISSVITIVGIFFNVKNINQYQNIFIILILAFISLAFYFWEMKRKLKTDGEMNLGNKGKKIILDDNELLITKKVGECLICHNKVYLYYDKSVHELLGKCSKNKKHLYSFDPTIDMGVPKEISTTYYSSVH